MKVTINKFCHMGEWSE